MEKLCEIGETDRISENRPQPKERPQPINIIPLHYGYQISIGCQAFAIENEEKLIRLLGKYLKNPEEVGQLWLQEGKLPE